MKHNLDHDFQQLRGAFNLPVAPAAEFEGRVLRQITSNAAKGNIGSAHLVPLPSANRWHANLMTAAVILVVIALTISALRPWQFGDDELRGITHYPASTPATSTPQDTSTVYGGFGGSDKSFEIGPVSDNLGDELQLLAVDDSQVAFRGNSLVVEDLLILSDAFQGKVTAYSATTLQQIWSVNDLKLIGTVSDGQQVYAFQGSGRYGVVALSLETGEEVWFHQDPSATSEEFQGNGPVVSGNRVYMNNGLNSFYALAADSGELIWETTVDSIDTNWIESQDDLPRIVARDPELAALDNVLIALIDSQFLTAIDTSDGSVLWTKRVAYGFGPGFLTAQLSTTKDFAIVSSVRDSFSTCKELRWCHEYHGASVEAFDIATGELFWSKSFNDLISRTVVAGSDVYAFTLQGVSILNPASGEIVAELEYEQDLEFDDSLTFPAAVRRSGDTIYAVFATASGYAVSAYEHRRQSEHWTGDFESDMRGGIANVFALNGGLMFQYQSGWMFAIQESAPSATPITKPENEEEFHAAPFDSGSGRGQSLVQHGFEPEYGAEVEQALTIRPMTSIDPAGFNARTS